jgi:ribosomal protein L40E
VRIVVTRGLGERKGPEAARITARSRREKAMAPMAGWNREEWMWTIRNLVAILAAVLLASILSSAQVFREASLGGGFSASDAVRLLGYGTALALIWITAWRAAKQMPTTGAVARLLHEGLPPFATLLILPGVYGLIHPFLTDRAVIVVSWVFVLLLLATAVWLGLVLYANAEALVLGAAAIGHRFSEAAERQAHACQKCGAPNSEGAKYCTSCGASLTQSTGPGDRVTAASEVKHPPPDVRRSA